MFHQIIFHLFKASNTHTHTHPHFVFSGFQVSRSWRRACKWIFYWWIQQALISNELPKPLINNKAKKKKKGKNGKITIFYYLFLHSNTERTTAHFSEVLEMLVSVFDASREIFALCLVGGVGFIPECKRVFINIVDFPRLDNELFSFICIS